MDFLWGASTAAYQIEGAVAEDGRGPSIWDTFSHTPGRVADGDTGDVAADHYHRWRDDVALMRELGITAYRFSIAWPRVLPTGRGRTNPAGLDFYEHLVDALLGAGIAPVPTLYHWDLPQALQDAGGWAVPETAAAFGDYAAAVVNRLGDRVHTWLTVNEPWCAAFLGYGSGDHAPGIQSHEQSLLAAHFLNAGHARAVDAVRAGVRGGPARVGAALNLHTFLPQDSTSGIDREAAHRYDVLGNEIWLGPMLEGRYSDELRGLTERWIDWDAALAAGAVTSATGVMDSVGINYYNSMTVAGGQVPASPPAEPGTWVWKNPWMGCEDLTIVDPQGPTTGMGWGIDPAALGCLLVGFHQRFPGTRIWVTENGAAYADEVVDGAVHDPDRIGYLRQHLQAAGASQLLGVPLDGYFAWSLLDNFEWAHGYRGRFGLVHVDYPTGRRTRKDSFHWYRDLVTKGLSPAELLVGGHLG